MKLTLDSLTMVAFFALLPAVAVGGAMALPVLLSAAAVLAIRPSLFLKAFRSPPITLLILFVFLGWAASSSLWALTPSDQPAKLLALLVFGSVFVASAALRTQRAVAAASAAAMAVLLALYAVEALGGLPLSRAASPDVPLDELSRRINRATTVVMALAFPVTAALLAEGRSNAARVLIVATLICMLPSGQTATLVAFGLGLLALALALAAPRPAIWLVGGGLAVWMLAAPFLTPLFATNPHLTAALPESWAARFGIWSYTCERIFEQPWIGHGLDASRAVTDTIPFSEGVTIRAIQVHPHSASLQVWFETGAVGALLAAAALVAGAWSLARWSADDRLRAAGAASTLASLGFVANVSYSAWQEWWLATLFIAAACLAAMPRRERTLPSLG